VIATSFHGAAGMARAAAMLLLAAGCVGCQVSKTQDQPKDKPADWFEGGPMQTASAETLQLTARVLAAKGRTEQAGFLLERMLAEYPDHIGTYSEGAEVLLVEGRVAEAIKWLDRGLVRMPNQPILVNDRGLCHLLNADLPSATADFQKAYDADPADADYVSNLALAKALAGDEAGARQLWSRVLAPADVESNLKTAKDARPKFKSPKDLGMGQ
jgi:Flp pilus assembly protein TadD